MTEPNEDKQAIAEAAEGLDPAAFAAQHRARRRAAANPKMCSNCLNGAPAKGGMLVETQGEEGKILLCSLRCMAIWSMTRGWTR